MRCKWLISVGLVVCLVLAFALPMCAPTPPVEEEKPPVEEEELANSIKAYMCTGIPDCNKDCCDFIRKELGVEVRQTFMSFGEIGAKLEAEAPRFSADMVIGMGEPQVYAGVQNGWFIPYASPPWQGESEVYADPDHYWVNLGISTAGWVVNTDLLAEKGYTMPEIASYKILLDPKWKGEIVVPSPLTSGSGWDAFLGWLLTFGVEAGKEEEDGWKFLEAVDRNIHHYTRSGGAPLELVSRGEVIMGLGTEVAILARIKEGYPIAYVTAEEPLPYHGVNVSILKGCTELYTCQKIVDALWSEEWCEIYSGWGFATRHPKWQGAGLAAYYKGTPKFLNMRFPSTCADADRLRDEWKERIGRVAE